MTAPLDGLHELPGQLATLHRPNAGIDDFVPLQGQPEDEQKHNEAIQHCAKAIFDFAIDRISPVVINADAASVDLIDVASTTLANDWLREKPESPEDTQVAATVVLGLFEAIPEAQVPEASDAFMGLRGSYGRKIPPGGMDTTYGLLARMQDRVMSTHLDKGGLGERLSDEQLDQLAALRRIHMVGRTARTLADKTGFPPTEVRSTSDMVRLLVEARAHVERSRR